MRVVIVRLGALGDIAHTIPVAAALRRHRPDATIDWVVDEANADLLALVPVIDRRIVLRSRTAPTISAWRRLRRQLRDGRYDVALDLQGLGKSALVARLSGAGRIVGFTTPFLRETWAGPLYTERADPGDPIHVVDRNLGILTALGIGDPTWAFPLDLPGVEVGDGARRHLGADRFALLNPSTAWSHKCWPPERFGAVAAHLRDMHGLRTLVTWGPAADEARRADMVVAASSGAAVRAPRTTLIELAALLKAGRLVVGGDTGPLHLAAALGTPVVGIYGPSDPTRNGPWSASDEVVSAPAGCDCMMRYSGRKGVGMVRRCAQATRCLDGVSVAAVCAAVDRRLTRTATDA